MLSGRRLNREDALVAIATTTRYTGSSLMGIVLAIYVGRESSPFVVGMVLAVYALGMTVFAPLVGMVADVTGRYRFVLVSTGTIATAVAALLMLAESTWSIVLVRGVYAAFEVGFIPVMLSLVSERGGVATRGQSIGYFNSAVALGYSSDNSSPVRLSVCYPPLPCMRSSPRSVAWRRSASRSSPTLPPSTSPMGIASQKGRSSALSVIGSQ